MESLLSLVIWCCGSLAAVLLLQVVVQEWMAKK